MVQLISKIRRKLLHLRLQPIRVFCFHEVNETDKIFPDWIPVSFLKATVKQMLEEGYTFISLAEAYKHISNDVIRTKKYAVLTADDGLRCHLDILPWLEENRIPLTLSLNVISLEQQVCGLPYKNWYHIEDPGIERQYAELLYISEMELKALRADHVSIAPHGVNHDEAATDISIEALEQDIKTCIDCFSPNKYYVPFYVYKYGKHNSKTDAMVRKYGLIPVLADGEKNYNNPNLIHREVLEAIYRKCRQK